MPETRRWLIRLTITGAALLSLVSAAAHGAARAQATLAEGRWAPTTRQALQRLIDQHSVRNAGYDRERRPYAVFDWDDTSIIHDTQEALFLYQIDQMAFRLTPEEFERLLTDGLPADRGARTEALAADLRRDFRALWQAGPAPGGDSPDFQDFKAKMLHLYTTLYEQHGGSVAYPWVTRFLANMTPGEVRQLTEAAIDANLDAALSTVQVSSPESRAGKAGVVRASHRTGLRTTPEMADLMHTLQANGIDVFVVTASLEEVVRVFASQDKYGYGVAPGRVIGMRLLIEDGRVQARLDPDWPVTVSKGKVQAIQEQIVRERGYGPILVAGDSEGDRAMLTAFADMRLGLIINRAADSAIAKLAPGGVDRGPRYVLQARDPQTGLWIPAERTLQHIKTERVLAPGQR